MNKGDEIVSWGLSIIALILACIAFATSCYNDVKLEALEDVMRPADAAPTE